MASTHLTSLSCMALLAFACGGQEPARSAEQHTPAPLASPASSEQAAAQSPNTQSSGPNTELTPASGPPAVAQNSLGAPKSPGAATPPATGSETTPADPPRTPDVVYVPTPQAVVDRMLQMAQVKKGDVVYDLGCGDGRIVITAAKRYGTQAFGFDIDPDRVAEAKANVKAAKLEHLVTIEQKDIFTLDLSPASVVTLYLLPRLNVKLIPQLEKLKPGSRIVSHDFNMEGIKPLQHVTLRPNGESEQHAIYLWKTPLVRE